MNEQQTVELGQVWEYTSSIDGTLMPSTVKTLRAETGPGCYLDESGFRWNVNVGPGKWRLLSPAPAPETACGAPEWCGFKIGDSRDPRRDEWLRDYKAKPFTQKGDHAYCSPVCRDSRVPPLPATPVPTATKDSVTAPSFASMIDIKTTVNGKCPLCGISVPETHIHVCGGSLRKAPPAQEAPKGPLVCDIARDTHAGPVLMRWIKRGQGAVPTLTPSCEQCHVLSERAGRFGGKFTATVLHDGDVAERLPRPKLAHQCFDDSIAGDV